MPQRIATINSLRGLAALAVAWFHFTYGSGIFGGTTLTAYSGRYGWLGVEVFFVISGFIIPYALRSSAYDISEYPRFLLKRIMRLDPPYLASIVIVLALDYMASHTPGFRGEPFRFNPIQTTLHLGYVNVFFGYHWLNVVYWTLAIEFQYYILMGLLFPLIAHKNQRLRLLTMVAFGSIGLLVRNDKFIFHWLSLFLIGMLTFQLWVGLVRMRSYFLGLFALGVSASLVIAPIVGVVGVAASIVIAFVNMRHRILDFLGDVSYSLYLLHVPIGGKLVNLGVRFVDESFGRFLLCIAALALSLLASWLLFQCIEKPSRDWASRIKYKPSQRSKNRLPVAVQLSSPQLHS